MARIVVCGRYVLGRRASVRSAFSSRRRRVQVISNVLDQCNGDLNEALEKLTELSLTSNSSEQCGAAPPPQPVLL